MACEYAFQNEAEVVEVRVKFPDGVAWEDDKAARRAIQVEARATSLVVREKGEGGKVLLEANPLFGKILAGETSWYLEDRTVVIVLQKAEEVYWPSIYPEDHEVAGEGGDRHELTGLSERAKVDRLLQEAKSGNLTAFQAAARAMADVGEGVTAVVAETKDGNGRSALHFAAQSGSVDVCRYLVEELMMDVDLRDDDGETALVHAARSGHGDLGLWLLEHGAEACAKGGGMSCVGAIHHAASEGLDELIMAIVERGENVNAPSDAGPPLVWAAGRGRGSSLRTLLDLGAVVNANSDGCSAIIAAAAAGFLEGVKLLIDNGADVNMKASQGATSLHVAADRGDKEVVEALLSAGADPDAVDEMGSKPIQAAAANRCEEVVEVLLSKTTPDPDVVPWTVQEVIRKQNCTMEVSENGSGGKEEKSAGEEKGGGLLPPQQDVEQKKKPQQPPPPPQRVEMDEKDPRVKQSLEAKSRGDAAFKKGDYMAAVDAYTQSIDLFGWNAAVLANRSLCWMRLGQAERALADAQAARATRPDWPKACYREGSALRLLGRLEDASNAFFEGIQLDPENKELIAAFRETVEQAKRQHAPSVGMS